MTDKPTETFHEAAAAPHAPGHFHVERVVFAVLLILSLIGMAVTDFSSEHGLTYWLIMVPVFGVSNIVSSWSRARTAGHSATLILRQQILHWGTLALAVLLVYLFKRTGHLDSDSAGLMALLALALTTTLAGVHFNWRWGVLGLLLGVAAACAALVDKFFWALAVPAALVVIAVILWKRRGDNLS